MTLLINPGGDWIATSCLQVYDIEIYLVGNFMGNCIENNSGVMYNQPSQNVNRMFSQSHLRQSSKTTIKVNLDITCSVIISVTSFIGIIDVNVHVCNS